MKKTKDAIGFARCTNEADPLYTGPTQYSIMRGRLSLRRRRVYTIEEIAEIVAPIAERYGAKEVWLFGSYARGEADGDSDVDIVVMPGEGWGIRIGTFWRDIRDALNKDVDMTTFDDKSFIDFIRKDMVQIYAS